MNQGTWTPERVAYLTELWSAGLKTILIARKLGLSKNTIVGKAHRLKLARRPSPIDRSGKPKKPCVPKKPHVPDVLRIHRRRRIASGKLEPTSKNYRMFKGSRFHTCQWIAGEASADDRCKCGKAVGMSKTYCPHHERRSRRVTVQPEQEAIQ